MAINKGNSNVNVYLGNKSLTIYHGTHKIYPCGNVVTYYVDTGKIYQEEVDEDVSCLQPKNFIPAKSGWEFVGWRQDTAANGSVLKNLTMKEDPVTLYAVFRKNVTIHYNGNDNTEGYTSQQNSYMYYNNGNLGKATFRLGTNGFTKAGHVFVCWACGSPSGTTYSEGERVSLSEDTVFYAVWASSGTDIPDVPDTPANDAPPFLSSGWRTITPWTDWEGVKGWSTRKESHIEYITPDYYWEDEGARFISEDRIDIYIHLVLSTPETIYGSYLCHSPSYTVGNFTRFELDLSIPSNDPDFYTEVSRYSNDGQVWTDWKIGTSLDGGYKYVQIGFFASSGFSYSSSDDSNEYGTGIAIKGAKFF